MSTGGNDVNDVNDVDDVYDVNKEEIGRQWLWLSW